jgi:iron complex outermembrane recepter protein
MSIPSLRCCVRLLVCLVFSSAVAATIAFGQPAATGSIQGRVYNPVSQEYVRNAEVRLDGTNRIVYTESDGSFQFAGVPAGTATIVIDYTGYQESKETLTVGAGQVVSREISLTSSAATPAPGTKDGVVKLDAFTVSSQREGNSKAIMDQRRNMNIVTTVSSDVFGDVTDGNVGEFLKYLPGVDLDYVESEPRGPRLGGMDGQYVGVSFDGMRTASADANRGGGSASRATSFEGFSITSVDSIEINRTASPENDADSPAGTVNMKMKRAFDRKGRRFDYNVGVNFDSNDFTLSKRVHPDEVSHYQWRPNWQFTYSQSFLDQKLGILLSANRGWSLTEQTSETMDYNTTPSASDARPMVVRQISYGDGPKWITKDALLLTADWKVTPHLVLSMNLNYSFFSGDFWNRNLTFVAANSNSNVNNGRSTVGGDGMLDVIATRAPSGSVNNVATVNLGGGGANKMTWTRQYSPRFEYKIGGLTVDGVGAYSKSLNHYEALLQGFSSSETGGWASGWTATRPNDRSWEWTIHQTSGADWFNLNNFTSNNTQTGGTSIVDRTETWATEKWTGMLNAAYVVPFLERLPTTVKVGGKWDEESRRNHNWNTWAKWAYVGPGGDTVAYNPATETYAINSWGNWANLGPQYTSPLKYDTYTTNMFTIYNINGVQGVPPRPSRSLPADLYHQHPELFVNTSNVNDYYNAFIANEKNFRQTITAAYAQADTRVTSKLQIRIGVRWEQTKNRFREFNPLTPTEMLSSPYASQFTKTVDAQGKTLVTPARATSVSGIFYQYTSKPLATRTSKYDNYFPSFVAKYNILPNLEWQAGVNKGISRPPIDNLTGLWSVNDNVDPPTVSLPNPNLLPEHHKVYQTRLAYYFGNRSPGQASIAFIQDEATNFITTHTYDSGAPLGVTDPIYDGYQFISTQNSTELQRYRNMDLNYQQTLGFLPSEYLRGVSIGGTYSRSYANQRRKNLAPSRFTTRLGYAYRRFNGAIGVVWRDKAPEDYGTSNYGRYSGAYTKIDVNGTFRLTRLLSLYLQVRNITNVKDESYWSPPGVKEGDRGVLRYQEQYGANWVFGMKGSF